MSKRDDTFHLEGIEQHLIYINTYVPKSKQIFLKDTMQQDAILFRLIAIGEEVAHLSIALTDRYSDIPWHQIVGLRNRIVHGYFEVDKESIWQALTDGSLDALSSVINEEL